MLNRTTTIKHVFDSFIVAENTMINGYKQYDDVIKQDILFDFMYEFFKEIEYYVKDSDYIDLVEEFGNYKHKRKGE